MNARWTAAETETVQGMYSTCSDLRGWLRELNRRAANRPELLLATSRALTAFRDLRPSPTSSTAA